MVSDSPGPRFSAALRCVRRVVQTDICAMLGSSRSRADLRSLTSAERLRRADVSLLEPWIPCRRTTHKDPHDAYAVAPARSLPCSSWPPPR